MGPRFLSPTVQVFDSKASKNLDQKKKASKNNWIKKMIKMYNQGIFLYFSGPLILHMQSDTPASTDSQLIGYFLMTHYSQKTCHIK